MRRSSHLEHPALRPLWASLERDWRLKAIAWVVATLVGLLIVAGSLVTSPVLLLIGGLMSIGCGLGLVYHLRQPSELSCLQDMLYDNPEEIVWVYTVITEHHPFGLNFNHRGIIYFKLWDGDEISAFVAPKKLKMMSKVLSRALPNTVFGYTHERAKRFMDDPRSLKK